MMAAAAAPPPTHTAPKTTDKKKAANYKPAAEGVAVGAQEAREEQSEYLAMSDFIAPKGSGVKDYIGLFAVTAGIGMDKLIAKYEADKDDYGKIMAQVSVKFTCFTGTKSTNTDCRTAGARRPPCRGVCRKAAS